MRSRKRPQVEDSANRPKEYRYAYRHRITAIERLTMK